MHYLFPFQFSSPHLAIDEDYLTKNRPTHLESESLLKDYVTNEFII